jgi:hypothetical protein
MDWTKDLQDLLVKSGKWDEGIIGQENLPFDELARGDWSGAATAPVSAAFNFLDIPLSVIKEGVGQGINATQGDGLGGWGTGREEWEEWIDDKPMPVKMALELGLDPTTYMGVGLVAKGAKALRGAAILSDAAKFGAGVTPALAGPRASTALRGAAKGLETANFVWDELPFRVAKRAANNPVTRPVGRVAKGAVERVVPKAFEFNEESKLRRMGNELASAFDEKLGSRGPQFRGMVPALVRGGTKSLAPIDRYDIPPFFAEDFDDGVPRAVVQKAYDSWLALRQQSMSNPEIPGVNTPGISHPLLGPHGFSVGPSVPANPAYREAGGLRDIARRFLGDPRLGIINTARPEGAIAPPTGGYREPQQAMENINEENMRHIANIMAATMVDFDNDTANKLFQPLRRANEGAELAIQRVTEEYGPGIRPAIPGAYEQANAELLREQGELGLDQTPLPDSRFFTPQGFNSERAGTKRLDAVESRIGGRGRGAFATADDALAHVAGPGFSKGSPELVEQAAGIGTGHMLATRDTANDANFVGDFNAWEGRLRPQSVDEQTKRAVVPDEFQSQWELNRDAFNTYLTSLFPGMERRPAEMETIRRMAVESLYDEYVDAASEVSGGTGGATTLLKKGRPEVKRRAGKKKNKVTGEMETVYRMRDQYAGEKHQKIGGIPDPGDPRQIGNRMETAPTDLPLEKHAHPSMKEYNLAEWRRINNITDPEVTPGNKDYREVFGRYPEGGMTEERIMEMIEAQGGTPWIENTKVGPLPNAERLIEMLRPGKDALIEGMDIDKFYDDAVDEVLAIVGPGRYEDARMLMEIMAITSAGTEVTQNSRLALKAFAEWKLGSDEAIRTGLGLTQEQADRLLMRGGEWRGVSGAFREGMTAAQKKTLDKAFDTYIKRRAMLNPPDTSVQGGVKTHNFAGSFVVNLWQDAAKHALADRNPELYKRISDALDKAMVPFTVDRHQSRVFRGATAVNPMQAIAQREAGIIAAKKAGMRTEDLQSNLWYVVKDNQGFSRVGRSDDMAKALREAWESHQDPTVRADLRAKLIEDNPDWIQGINPDGSTRYAVDLDRTLDDMMRQEAAIAIINEELAPVMKTIEKEMGFRVPIAALQDAGDTALGIINRAGRGISPRTKASSRIANLAVEAEQELGRIRRGESVGTTYGWDGNDFVPENPTSGFAVAITSAGRAVDTAKPKSGSRTINDFLLRYSDLLDDEELAGRIKFGTFPMEGRDASFDLSIIAPDERTALDIARRANQKAIYDIGNGRILDSGGEGTPVINRPEDVRKLVESVFGKPAKKTATGRPSLREAMERGATIDELDSVNPLSILNRKLVRPIMERYEEASRAYVSANPDPDQRRLAGGQGQIIPSGVGDPATPFDFESIGHDPLISTQANTLLNQTFDNGEKYGERMQKYFDEGEKDISLLDQRGIRWDPDATLRERLDLAAGDKDIEDIIKKYDKAGIDPRYSTPRDLANLRMQRDLGEGKNIDFNKTTTWDLIRAAWGELALFSPKYHFGNIQGAWIQNAIVGHFETGTPGEYLSAVKLSRGGLEDTTRKEYLRDLKSYQVFNKWGFEELPSWVSRGGVRAMTSNKTRSSRSAVGELTTKLTRSDRLGRQVGKPFVFNADLSQGIETVIRGTLAADVLDREMTNAMAVIEDGIRVMADRQGLEGFEFSILNNINTPNFAAAKSGVTAKILKEHLMSLGFAEGYAERAGRNFSEAKNAAEQAAKREVEKRQFSYDRTNLDEFVGKFIPFHYWYSRALRYYGEEAIRNPQLILNYMRANRGIENAQEDPGLSARQKGFLRLMGTPLGFTLLMNPDSLFGVVKVFGLQDNYTPEGETEAGGVISWLKARGLGLYPWIDGTLNMMGVYGDTFEPDLLGIRHRSLIGAAVNYVRSVAGFDPGAAPYASAMGQARYHVSSFVAQFTPDWFSQPVLPKAGGSSAEATLESVIESRVIAENPGLTNEQLLDIITNPESPEYQAAYRQAASAGLAQQLLNFTIPQQFRVRDAARDVRAAQVSTIFEAAEKQGVEPWEFKPTVADAEFATRYKQLTGKDWKPGDYSSAMLDKNLTEAVPEAKPFVLAENEYNNLGGERNAKIFGRYTDLRNGIAPSTADLDDDRRRAIADLWAEQNGYTDNIDYVYQLRDAFEKTHPEFGQFKSWQSQMYSLKSHLGGSFDEYRRQAIAQNPNAAIYFDKTSTFIRENYPQDQWPDELDRRTVNAEAFFAINGLSQERYDSAPVGPAGDVTGLSMMSQQQGQQYYPEDWVSSQNNVWAGPRY